MVWGWGLNRPMVAQLPNLALRPNEWLSANFGVSLDWFSDGLARLGGV